MKKAFAFIVILLSISSAFANGIVEDAEKEKLVVYAYDSFASDWGPGATVIPEFIEETGIDVELVSSGDAVEMLNKIILEGENCRADVVLGISDDIAHKIYPYMESYSSPYLQSIDDELEFDPEHRLIPFDYGAFAFVYDTQSGLPKPESLSSLADEIYQDKVILIDPRTSSVGMGLLMWSYNEFGDDYLSWWEKMEERALTIASGWSSAYGLFTEGEAPLVLSYTTSPVYHVMNEDTTRYEALVFDDGHQATIEGIGLMKSSNLKDEAKIFIDYILSSAQKDIAVLNSMYPTNGDTLLPDAFDYAPKPAKIYKSGLLSEEKANELLESWTKVMTD